MTAIRTLTQNHDFNIHELPASIEKNLINASFPWLNSYAFCTGYGNKTAERVWLIQHANSIQQAIYYRIVQQGFVKILEVVGFTGASDDEIKTLIEAHKAHLAVVSRTERPVKQGENWKNTKSNVYLKEYITIVPLPTNKEEYLNQLGKNKRKQLPQWYRRINRYFNGDVELRFEKGQDIRLEDVVQLECLNRDRRAGKGKGVDSIDIVRKRQTLLFPMTQSLGLLTTLRHKGEIIGGNLNFLYRDMAYMVVTGHNPELEELRIGNVAIWKTMDYLIDHNYKACNFLWGRKFYKTQFLGIEYPWTIHIISTNILLSMFWKYKIAFEEFFIRLKRFVLTRLGLS